MRMCSTCAQDCAATESSVSPMVASLLYATVTTEIRTRSPVSGRGTATAHYPVIHHEEIHVRAEETIQRFLRLADHGLVFVERRVEHHRHPRQRLESRYHAVVARVRVRVHRLQTSRPVDVRHRGNERPL